MTQAKNRKVRPSHLSLSEKIIRVLVGYIQTQLVLVLIVAIASWILLSLIGVQFPLLLAMMTGSLSVVPILGMTVAGIIVSAVAVFDAVRFLPDTSVLLEGVVIVAVYGLLNFAVDYFVSPYLVGKVSGVHPVMLLVFVMIGTFVFGVWGAFLTVPVILVVKTITSHYIK